MCASHDTRWATPVSPRYRRFQQMHYHQYSERDAGISHLWHAHRLAEARLRPGPGITDAPETDFRHPERMDFSQTKACALMTRLQRRVVDEEKRIVKENRNMLRHMVDVNDDGYRERQGLNNYPSKTELKKWYRADEQVLARQRDRAHQEANTRKKNLVVMKHLIDVKPFVESAKQLNKWYKLDHKRRVKELSQFNRMEPFAGANVLRKECGVKLPRRTPDSVELRTAVQQPLLCGEYKIPTLMETLTTRPMLPSLQEAAENYAAGNLTLNETGDFAFTWTHTGYPKKKPGWKNISALDVRLMNYASDLMLARGGELPRVSREDENGVTRLWRKGLERNYRAKGRYMKEGEQQDTNVMDTINGGKGDRRVSNNTIMWNKDRWRSRTSIFTLLRTKGSKHFEKNYLESFNIPGGAAPRRQNEHRDGSMQTEPTLSLVFEESEKPLWEPLHMGAGPLFPDYDVFSKAAASAVDEVRKTSRGSGVPYEHAAPAVDEVRKTSRGSGIPYEHAAPAVDEVRKTSRGSGVPYEHAAPAVDEVRKTTDAPILEKDPRRKCSLADWTAELRRSDTPFVPY